MPTKILLDHLLSKSTVVEKPDIWQKNVQMREKVQNLMRALLLELF